MCVFDLMSVYMYLPPTDADADDDDDGGCWDQGWLRLLLLGRASVCISVGRGCV